MRLIALEEHFRSPALKAAGARATSEDVYEERTAVARAFAKLDDVGEARLEDMDRGGIDLQVLSHAIPSAESFQPDQAVALAAAANDYLAGAIALQPTRFAGFAMLPTPAPLAAAAELQRAVVELGLKGALINGHTQGRFLDDRFFWPIFERAQDLAVPIYLHPAEPPLAVREAYYSNLPAGVGQMLATAGWGWHVDTGLHVLRLILGHVFDEFPGLQIIVGHMGEALPFMLARATHNFREAGGLAKPLDQYVGEHLHFTTSGMFAFAPLLCLIQTVGVDRILYSVDYPFSSNEDGKAFLDGLEISRGDREKIAHRNAERLLQVA